MRAGLIGLLDAAVLHGCGQASDPSVPCRSLDLGDAAPATVTTAEEAPVLVVSSDEPFVVVRVCPVDEPCVFHQEKLVDAEGNVGVSPGSAVMVTGLGNYVVAIDRKSSTLYAWDIDLHARSPEDAVGERRQIGLADGQDASVLVASMRTSDLVLLRDADNELLVLDPINGPRALPDGHPNLKVVAIGSKYIVGREDIDGESERLLLVAVDMYDDKGDPRDDDMRLLAIDELVEARNFSRVEITANDELVVATSGAADDGETFVFDVASGALLDRFIGAAVTGHNELEAVAGMRATSPDGSHLAYRTGSGALALRDLQSHTACLVRSSSAGDHRVAGFAADGMIYMQAELAFTESRVFAFDTSARELVALDNEPGTGHHLAAVPHLPVGSPPYAIGVRHGEYAGMQADREPTGLRVRDAVWLARDDPDGGIWAAETVRPSGSIRKLALRRFVPTFDGRAYRFDVAIAEAAEHPTVLGEAGQPLPTLTSMGNGDRPCLSSGTPGGWAYQCAGNGSAASFASGTPSSEDPGSPDVRNEDDEIPDGDGGGDESSGGAEAGDDSSDGG